MREKLEIKSQHTTYKKGRICEGVNLGQRS
jgi:hypothetical protein